jgi:hypothetical protein
VIAGCAGVAYPLIVLAGHSPHFPSQAECAQPALSDGRVDAVFGRFNDNGRAASRLRRATELGFQGLKLEPDGCGDVEVVLHGIPSLAVGRELVAEAARVHLHVVLQRPNP